MNKLPLDKPLPKLRKLDLPSTQVSEADAARFTKLHPQCKVLVRWEHKLAEALAEADRLRVRSGGTCHRVIARESTLHDEKDTAERNFDEPGLRAAAALTLARRGDKTLKPEIEKLLPAMTHKSDVAACQVALALSGDPAQLRPEHFKLQSHEIGIAAVRAIEQFQGAHGLDLLIAHGLHHPWAAVNDEAARIAQKIIGKEFPERTAVKALKEWWREHGPAFVEQRRKELAEKKRLQ